MIKQPICDKRYYVILGINKKDPTSMVGYCSYGYVSNNRVELIQLGKNESAQKLWNNCKNYWLRIPDEYEVKIFRLNSKSCPIVCDLRYRYQIDRRRKSMEFNRYEYEHPHCMKKTDYVGYGGKYDFPDKVLYKYKHEKTWEFDEKYLKKIKHYKHEEIKKFKNKIKQKKMNKVLNP